MTDAMVASRVRSGSDGLRDPAMPGTPIELAAAIADQAAPMSAAELAELAGDDTVPTKRPTIMELPRFSDHGSPHPTVAMTALPDGVASGTRLGDGADGDLAIVALLDRRAGDLPGPAVGGDPMTPAETRSLIATLLGVAPIAAPPPPTPELPVVVASTRLIEPQPAPAPEVLVERAPSPAADEGGADDLDPPVGLFPRWLGISLVAVVLVVAFALLVVLVRFSP